jgi:hypothetical protein
MASNVTPIRRRPSRPADCERALALMKEARALLVGLVESGQVERGMPPDVAIWDLDNAIGMLTPDDEDEADAHPIPLNGSTECLGVGYPGSGIPKRKEATMKTLALILTLVSAIANAQTPTGPEQVWEYHGSVMNGVGGPETFTAWLDFFGPVTNPNTPLNYGISFTGGIHDSMTITGLTVASFGADILEPGHIAINTNKSGEFESAYITLGNYGNPPIGNETMTIGKNGDSLLATTIPDGIVEANVTNSVAGHWTPAADSATVTIPMASQIIDSEFNVWTMVDGKALENGVATPSAAVIMLLYAKGIVYQENYHHDWWKWIDGKWIVDTSAHAPYSCPAT